MNQIKKLKNLRSIKYLNFLIEVHKDKAEENIIEHYKYLLLMLLIFQPPLRTCFYTTSKILRLYTSNHNKDNYVYITWKKN